MWNSSFRNCIGDNVYERSKMESVYDEEYLILRARGCQLKDPYAAKAWLITAKTLFPTNFAIQFEVYSNEKTCRNTKEAARHLEELFRHFQNDAGLWKELQIITEALQADRNDSTSSFLRDVFGMLSSDIQHQMLLSTADRSEDTQEHCRLLLLLLKKFPDKIGIHGMKLIDTLNTAEKHSHHSSPVNCFRKLLVHDILPLIFQSANVEFHSKQLFRLLHKCIEFYITYITTPPTGTTSVSNHATIPGLQDSESIIENPWEQLGNIFNFVGQKLNWELKDLFLLSSKEHQWQRIQNCYQHLPHTLDDVQFTFKQVFFSATILFLQSLYEYTSKVDPEQFCVPTGNTQLPSLVLIEGFRTSLGDCTEPPKPKKKHLDSEIREDHMPSFIISKSVQGSATSVTQNFVTAARCWDLLHSSEIFEKDFKRLGQQLRMEAWPWYLNFQLDLLIYQGKYDEAISRLQQLEGFGTPVFKNKVYLRMASCLFSFGMSSAACERILSIVVSLPKTANENEQKSNLNVSLQNNSSGRQLYFINYDRQEILQYCVKLILTCFKERALQPRIKDDLSLGHLLVLLQYDWPHTEPLFIMAVEKIKEQGSFSYNLFFNYIINIDMLEEFAHLAKFGGGSIHLDLLHVSTAQISKQRAITRGVNKGAKEDFRSAMERQVARCEESLDQLLIQFLTQEREVLQF